MNDLNVIIDWIKKKQRVLAFTGGFLVVFIVLSSILIPEQSSALATWVGSILTTTGLFFTGYQIWSSHQKRGHITVDPFYSEGNNAEVSFFRKSYQENKLIFRFNNTGSMPIKIIDGGIKCFDSSLNPQTIGNGSIEHDFDPYNVKINSHGTPVVDCDELKNGANIVEPGLDCEFVFEINKYNPDKIESRFLQNPVDEIIYSDNYDSFVFYLLDSEQNYYVLIMKNKYTHRKEFLEKSDR